MEEFMNEFNEGVIQAIFDGEDPKLDEKGLLCDVEQLRKLVHLLGSAIDRLTDNPLLQITSSREAMAAYSIVIAVHGLVCKKCADREESEETPAWLSTMRSPELN